ncbi:MAG: alpha-xylosidase [Anaerolineaceae bacterium]|nr:alpha-xylosidase [Anaerolineaceae bacterium]
MKFTDGYWKTRSYVTPNYPEHVYEFEIQDDTLTAFGPLKRIESRRDITDNGLLTVKFSSPMTNVIRVKIIHHKGSIAKQPQFEIFSQENPQVQIEEYPQYAKLTSGDLSVQINKDDDWKIEFLGNQKHLTESGSNAMGFMDLRDGDRYLVDQLSLSVGECVYGLGERFAAFVKNGQKVNIWNEDGGTGSEQAYKNIPFYLTNRGYGVFVNHSEKVSFEVASEKVERVQFSVLGEEMEYFLIYGPTPKEILDRYTALTGRPALPPAWSFGLWLSTSFTTDYNQESVIKMVDDMTERDIPLHVFHFDCFWMREYRWINFQWDERRFAEPAKMLAALKSRGLHISLWLNPYVAQQSNLFDEGMQNGYLLKRPDGSVWQWDMWQAGMGLIDFTNPAAREWFTAKLRTLLDMGVDCFKTDFAERIPTDVIYWDGSDPQKMHNYYTFLYNQTVFNVIKEKLGEGQAVLFARSATAGSQQFPVHWGGDNTASYESMAESLRGGLSLSLSGFGFWSHDIGGFEQKAPADLYKRWCAFGLLSSHSRLHGSESFRVPWVFDEESVDVLRFFTQLKCQLMPYIFQTACQAARKGTPVMRAMMLEFPTDPACDYLDRQYMLGDNLLVAPVFSTDGEVNYYLPQGKWTHFLTNEVLEGGSWFHETHDYFSLPLMARPNSLLAVGNNDQKPDYDYVEEITVHAFELEPGADLSVEIPDLDGSVALSISVHRENGQIIAKAVGRSANWHLKLRNISEVRMVKGGDSQSERDGVLITPDPENDVLTIYL